MTTMNLLAVSVTLIIIQVITAYPQDVTSVTTSIATTTTTTTTTSTPTTTPIPSHLLESFKILIDYGTITVPKVRTQSFASFTVTVYPDLARVRNFLQAARSAILIPKFKFIETITGDPELSLSSVKALTALSEAMEEIILISQYKDNNVRYQPNYSCNENITITDSALTYKLEKNLDNLISTIDQQWTTADLGKPENKARLINFIRDSSDEVLETTQAISSHLTTLDQITSGILPGETLSYLQRVLPCIPIGRFDQIRLIGCQKNEVGLTCDLSLDIFEHNQKYDHYIPVNYLGAELDIGQPLNKIVKIPNQSQFYILNCSAIEESVINQCQVNKWESTCAKALSNDNLDTILSDCPFKFIPSPPPQQTELGGVLVMNADYNLHVLDQHNTRIKTLENKSPMLIFSPHTICAMLGTEEVRFPNNKGVSTEHLVYSALNSTVQNMIRLKAIHRMITDWDWKNILQYAALFVHVGIFPIAVVSCCVSLKALHAFRPVKNVFRMKTRNSQHSPEIRRTNFIFNKKVTKKQRKK